MGSYTYGNFEVSFSRTLTDEEFEKWIEACKDRCSNCLEVNDYETFDPNGWYIHNTSGNEGAGDCGELGAFNTGFAVFAEGKVYDLVHATRHFIHSLPPDVTVEGSGIFETEGEHWGMRAKRRELQELNAEIVLEPWKEDPIITAAYAALELEDA